MKMIFQIIEEFLMRPKLVLIGGVTVALLSILFDGTLYQIWELKAFHKSLQEKTFKVKESVMRLESQIKQANDTRFIEKEARNRFDLVRKDDIVFVFADE